MGMAEGGVDVAARMKEAFSDSFANLVSSLIVGIPRTQLDLLMAIEENTSIVADRQKYLNYLK